MHILLIPLLLLLAFFPHSAAAAPLVSIADHGAKADGKTDNAPAIMRAIDTAAKAGGGTVLVPAGKYLTTPIRLQSRITLQLEPGAVLKASPRLTDYPPEAAAVSGEFRPGLITAKDAQDVAIIGRGVIDGSGPAFVLEGKWKPLGSVGSRKFTRQGENFMHPRFGTEDGPLAPAADRPGNLIRLINCANVLLNGVTIQNSPTWTIQVNNCENVKILAVNINSNASSCRVPNDDGIDLVTSRKVQIANCDIQTGDDCIALFGSEDVAVSNCTLTSKSTAVRVGYDSGLTRRCVFSNLTIRDSNRGLLVNVRGDGSVEDILFSNIAISTRLYTGDWWGKGEPIHVSAIPHVGTRSLGTIRNVRFQNIVAESEAGIIIYGSERSRIEDVSLRDVRVTIRKSPLHPSYGGNFDLRSADRDERALFKHDIPAVFARYVKGLQLRGIEVRWAEGLADFFTHAIQCEEFEDLDIEAFRGRQARGVADAAIALAHGREARVRNSLAAAGTGVFLSADDVKRGWITGNDLSLARIVSMPAGLSLDIAGNRNPKAQPGPTGN